MTGDLLARTVERIDRCEDVKSLWAVVRETADAFGFEGVSYEFTRFGVLLGRAKAELYEESFATCWQEEDAEEIALLRDVVFRRAYVDAAPFSWSELPHLPWVDGMSRDVASAIARCGRPILTVPVSGPHVRHGYFAFVSPEGHVLDRYRKRVLQLIAHVIHLRWTEIDESSGLPETPLTPRERSVLGWLARGKSNPEIADILGIAPSTIDTYVRRIYGKFGVHDRVTAAIIASALGLLHDPSTRPSTP